MAAWPTTKYSLNQRAYIPRTPGLEHEILEAGAEVVYDGKPGPHMDALTPEGVEAKERAGPQRLDFTSYEPLAEGDDDDRMAARIAKAIAIAMIQLQVAPAPKAAAPPPIAARPPPPPPPPPAPKH